MKHTYQIEGMSCKGCRNKVDEALNAIDGVSAVVSLVPPSATVITGKALTTNVLQHALSKAGNYTIKNGEVDQANAHGISDQGRHEHKTKIPKIATPGNYYCPMHCEGEKNYEHSGSCPVCGMNLVKAPVLKTNLLQYSCPMHPEIIRDSPGICPICGMDLVRIENGADLEDRGYLALQKKFVVAVCFTLPVFLISMSEMIPANPLFEIMALKYWNIAQ